MQISCWIVMISYMVVQYFSLINYNSRWCNSKSTQNLYLGISPICMCVCDFLSVSILKYVSSYLLLVSSLYYNEDVLIKMLFYTHELDLVHTLWGQAFQWELITSTITYHNMRDSAYLMTSLYIVRHGEEEMKQLIEEEYEWNIFFNCSLHLAGGLEWSNGLAKIVLGIVSNLFC